MDHPVVCRRVLASSLWAHSGGQLVGSCRFSSKLHEQSKLEVQPSLEAKPLWAIHTPVPVWDQWLKPPAYSHPLPPSLSPLSSSPLSLVFAWYRSHKYRVLTLPHTSYLLINRGLQVSAVTGLNGGLSVPDVTNCRTVQIKTASHICLLHLDWSGRRRQLGPVGD